MKPLILEGLPSLHSCFHYGRLLRLDISTRAKLIQHLGVERQEARGKRQKKYSRLANTQIILPTYLARPGGECGEYGEIELATN